MALPARGAMVFMIGAFTACAAADVPFFYDEALKRGISYVVIDGAFGGNSQYGCGVALCDLDQDGDDDIVAMGAATNQLALFENNGAGLFVDRTVGSGLPVASRASGIVAGDYDGDGDLDLFVTRWLQPAMLLRNEGALHFANATAQALLTGISGPGSGCAFGDYDADGDIDLAVGMRTGSVSNFMRNRLYRNNGNGTFTDVAAALGVDDSFPSFQCLLQDFDRDGDSDLYVSTDKGFPGIAWNRFFRNQGGVFTEDPDSGSELTIDSMGVCAGDLDMNGHIDIYCTNLPTGNALLASDDSLHYTRRDGEAGVRGLSTGWAPLIFDADNDVDQDLFACSMTGAPDYLWLTEQGFPLIESQAACGIGDPDDSYCLGASDIDSDGDVDLLMQSRGVNLRMYVNTTPQGNHGLTLRIIGVGKNTYAVGALADIEVNGKTVLREVIAGSSYKSQSSYLLHSGLGLNTTAERVTVRWPRVGAVREERVLTNVPSGLVVAVYPPSRIGDALGDGRVDPADLVACTACVGGAFSAACAVFDVDGDCDIDAADRAQIELRMIDLDHDGVIGARDLALLLDGWARPARDITGDATVDAADVARMMGAW